MTRLRLCPFGRTDPGIAAPAVACTHVGQNAASALQSATHDATMAGNFGGSREIHVSISKSPNYNERLMSDHHRNPFKGSTTTRDL